MSQEQINLDHLDLSKLPEEFLDHEAEADPVISGEFPPPHITPKIVFSELSEKESYESMNPPSPPTYELYISEGSRLLRDAISVKEKDSIKAAGVIYREAAAQFLGAITFSPDDKNPNSIDGVDPILLLQYASCLTMQIEAGAVLPYRESIWLSREADLRQIASEALKKVDENIMGPSHVPHVPNEDRVKGGLVIAVGLSKNHEAKGANDVADRIEVHFDPEADTKSDVLQELKDSDEPILLAARRLADKALLELTISAELRMAA
jgi:hypothetical protein